MDQQREETHSTIPSNSTSNFNPNPTSTSTSNSNQANPNPTYAENPASSSSTSSASTPNRILSESTNSKHCEFCLIAEFDIDRGSTLSFQYPNPIQHDNHVIAELMLPDGAHARAEDWTVFFLKDPLARSNSTSIQSQQRPRTSSSSRSRSSSLNPSRQGGENEEDLEKERSASPLPPSSRASPAGSGGLTYVLNLVRTKHDNSVRRGAMVKALAIGTKHPFIQVFKPLLLIALEEYFTNPSIDPLIRLYESINSLDLTAMPNFSREEKLILRSFDRPDLFEEKFLLIEYGQTSGSRGGSGGSVVGINGSNSNPLDQTLRASEANKLLESSLNASELEESNQISNNHEENDLKKQPQNYHRRVDSSSGLSINENSQEPPPPSTSHPPNSSNSSRIIPRRTSAASLRPSILRKASSASNDQKIQNSKRPPSPSPSTILNNANARSISPAHHANASIHQNQNARTGNQSHAVKDTHFFDTQLFYGERNLPLRVPTSLFDEEVGDYSLSTLITAFSSHNSMPSGPQHPHLHSNGSLTHPIVLLFNALATQKRVVFLGHGQPAGKVANFVLAACALGSGCGAVFRGFSKRAFPYTNLTNLDELEKITGYIAGVTNPRFEDLHAWDVLFNLENGKVTIAKDIEPAPPMAANPRPAMTREPFSHGSLASMGSDGTKEDGSSAVAPTTSSIRSGRERAGTTSSIEARQDAPDNIFMDELVSAILSNRGEKYIRARVYEFALNFAQSVARHEEHFYGHTSLGLTSQPYLNGQLGSGIVFSDRETELREISFNAMRCEGWRRSQAYRIYKSDEKKRNENKSIRGFDALHQIQRLKRAKGLAGGELELMMESFVRGVRSEEQIVEFLSLLPQHSGGLSPVGFALLHPSSTVRNQVVELFSQISTIPIGKKSLQTLNFFQRLAFARLLNDRTEELKTRDREKSQERFQNEMSNSGLSFPHSPGPIGSSSGWPRAVGSAGAPLGTSNASNALSNALGAKERGRDEITSKFDSLSLPPTSSSISSRSPSPISPRVES